MKEPKKIWSIKNIPEDMETFVDNFVNEMMEVEIWNEGTKTTFMEMDRQKFLGDGPRKGHIISFETVGMQFPYNFDVIFNTENGALDVFFQGALADVEVSGMMKMAFKMVKKMANKQFPNMFGQYIKSSIQKAIRK